MTPPPPNLPSEDEVRALVARVVDATLGAGKSGDATPTAAVDTGHPATGTSSDAEDTAEPHPGTAAAAIAVGADHGGYPLKERLVFRLREAGYDVIDCGTSSTDSVDYPDFAYAVATSVADGTARWGIVVDGAGIGSAMVANKVPGIRAALCYDISTARNSREHNHANVLTLGAGMVGDGLAWQIVQEWLAVGWGGGRHARRVDKITEIERRYSKS